MVGLWEEFSGSYIWLSLIHQEEGGSATVDISREGIVESKIDKSAMLMIHPSTTQ